MSSTTAMEVDGASPVANETEKTTGSTSLIGGKRKSMDSPATADASAASTGDHHFAIHGVAKWDTAGKVKEHLTSLKVFACV